MNDAVKKEDVRKSKPVLDRAMLRDILYTIYTDVPRYERIMGVFKEWDAEFVLLHAFGFEAMGETNEAGQELFKVNEFRKLFVARSSIKGFEYSGFKHVDEERAIWADKRAPRP